MDENDGIKENEWAKWGYFENWEMLVTGLISDLTKLK